MYLYLVTDLVESYQSGIKEIESHDKSVALGVDEEDEIKHACCIYRLCVCVCVALLFPSSTTVQKHAPVMSSRDIHSHLHFPLR